VANILILTPDRQMVNQWISQISAEHTIFSTNDRPPPVSFVQEKMAEMAIVDGDLLADDPITIASLIGIGLKILVIGKNWPEEKQINALLTGCYGYCEIDTAAELQLKAVNSILKGDVWASRQLIPKVISLLVKLNSHANQTHKQSRDKKKNLHLLTHREIDVLKMLGEGMSNKSIASRLNISERTVKAHLTSIFQKLEVQDRLQLALLLKDIN
jgi:two-component system nitrate/nitrite response regulator NarL